MSRDVTLLLGATPDAMTGTGYDALELIEDGRGPDGYALGLSMRVAGYAGVPCTEAAVVADAVGRSAVSFKATILALPVSRKGADADLAAIWDTLPPGNLHADVILRGLAITQDLAISIGRCRDCH
jgi:hypothetical protein